MKLQLTLIKLADGSYRLDTFETSMLEMMEPHITIIGSVDILLRRRDFWPLVAMLGKINYNNNRV